MRGDRCWQPISGRCVKHVGPITAHCWVFAWDLKDLVSKYCSISLRVFFPFNVIIRLFSVIDMIRNKVDGLTALE